MKLGVGLVDWSLKEREGTGLELGSGPSPRTPGPGWAGPGPPHLDGSVYRNMGPESGAPGDSFASLF